MKGSNKKDVILPHVTYSEVVTVMAALRVFEKILKADEKGKGYEQFSADDLREMEHFEEAPPLTPAEIERLVRRITIGPAT